MLRSPILRSLAQFTAVGILIVNLALVVAFLDQQSYGVTGIAGAPTAKSHLAVLPAEPRETEATIKDRIVATLYENTKDVLLVEFRNEFKPTFIAGFQANFKKSTGTIAMLRLRLRYGNDIIERTADAVESELEPLILVAYHDEIVAAYRAGDTYPVFAERCAADADGFSTRVLARFEALTAEIEQATERGLTKVGLPAGKIDNRIDGDPISWH